MFVVNLMDDALLYLILASSDREPFTPFVPLSMPHFPSVQVLPVLILGSSSTILIRVALAFWLRSALVTVMIMNRFGLVRRC